MSSPADDLVVEYAIVLLITAAIAVRQWLRARAAKKKFQQAQSELKAAHEELRKTLVQHAADLAGRDASHQAALAKLTEDFSFQTRSLRAAMANSARKHRSAIQTAQRNESRLIDEVAQAKQLQAELQMQNSALRSQVGYVPGLAARIRHDVPKGLRKLSAYLESVLPAQADRLFVKEELETVMDKIELHLANEADIQKHVRETLSRISDEQTNQLPHAQRLVSLTEYLRYLVRTHRFQGVEFEEELAVCRMRGLPMHWDLMLTNILSNADFFAQQQRDGRISIATKIVNPGRVDIEITNDGPHIPGRVRDQVFHLGFTTKPGGRGLGLFVAREIARGLGGDIQIPENVGMISRRVRFTVTNLPIVLGEGDSHEAGELPADEPR